MSSRPLVAIVSPSSAAANNGNWRTAERWQQLLAPHCDVRIAARWQPGEGGDVMLALHARRSAEAVAAWAQAHPGRGLAVVLTGTDLYHDIATDPAAQRALRQAQRLVVLQECGAEALPQSLRGKARVIYQSAPARPSAAKPVDALQAVMVGHLRPVKSPETLFAAARLLRPQEAIRLHHIGGATGEPALGELAQATAAACPHYDWLGPLPHAETLESIRCAHVLVHTSAVEGGAHVLLEAVRSGTPVLASRIDGNVGMLGADYDGYFPHGDAAGLAALLRACRGGQRARDAGAALLARLGAQCALRSALFDPAAEQAALLQLVHELHTQP